jgi:hypothetical protein
VGRKVEKSSSIFNFKKIPSGIIGLVVIFLLAEIASRILWNPAYVGEDLYSRFEPNYEYGYSEHTPVFHETGNRLVCLATQYTQFHRQDLPKIKQKNEIRIFTLGGSVSRGTKENNYSAYLEKRLKQAAPEYDWHLINLSSGGYGSSRMLVLMKKILEFAPDLFILHPHGSNEYEDERDFNYQKKLHEGINKMIFKSHFLVLSKKKYDELSKTALPWSDAQNELEASADPENIARWHLTLTRNLKEMMEMARNVNAGVVLIGRADRNDGGEGYANQESLAINRIINRISWLYPDSFYLDTPDLMGSYFPGKQNKKILFEDTTHWNEIGHEMVAEKLVQPVLSLIAKRNR